ncbi:MAG: phosphatase PAP2 family protein [Nitrospirota bacterium]
MVMVRNIGFDWFSYSLFFALGIFMITMGLFYRSSGRSERISMTLMATGLLLLFTIVLSVFGYLLLPLWREPIDPFLVQIDAWLGYSWPEIVQFSGQHPLFNEMTRYAYLSSIPQMALLFIILGFGGKQKELHVFILSITVSGLVTLAFWALFPAFGPSVLYDISGTIEQAARPLVGSSYGVELLRLGAEGPKFISPRDMEGLVAFPSYHTIMAVLAMYSARTTRWLFPIMVLINLFVIPGVLIHGGHHLIDVFGGLLTAWCIIYVARHVVTGKEIQPDGVFFSPEDEITYVKNPSSISGLHS